MNKITNLLHSHSPHLGFDTSFLSNLPNSNLLSNFNVLSSFSLTQNSTTNTHHLNRQLLHSNFLSKYKKYEK